MTYNTNQSRVWRLCLAFSLSALVSTAAHAADDRAERERAAKKACLSGDYAAGVSLLVDLYVDTNDPAYIFNQGRCFEQSGRCEEAIIRFREYLRKTKDAGKASDGRAEQHIRDCEELVSKTRETKTPTATAGSGAASDAVPVAAPPTNAVPATTGANSGAYATATPGSPPSQAQAGLGSSLAQPAPGRGLRIAGAVTFGIGVAAIGAGVGFALAANSLASELEASPSSYQRSKESTRASYATASAIGYAAGGVCAAGGVLLYVLGLRQDRVSSVRVEPMISARGMGAVAGISF